MPPSRSGGRLQGTAGAHGIAGQHAAPVDAPVAGPKVGQCKAVTRGFGCALSAADLAQVPVIELVAVEKAQHLAPGPEADGPAEPLEGEAAPRLAAGPVIDLLVPGAKRFGYLELDQPVFVPAEGRQVRRLPVAQRPGADAVTNRWR